MKELVILLIAIVLLILGIKGTYAGLWNKLFPNYPLTVAPPVAVGSGGQPGITIGWGGGTSSNSPSSGGSTSSGGGGGSSIVNNPQYNPVAAGQQTGTAARQKAAQIIKSITDTSQGTLPATNTTQRGTFVNVPPGYEGVLSTGGPPSWWPSWLPYPAGLPLYGEGSTGQVVKAPPLTTPIKQQSSNPWWWPF